MMTTLEELKVKWEQKGSIDTDPPIYTEASLVKIIRNRVMKDTKHSLMYFWASFTLQIIVYSLLSHVIVKYAARSEILYLSIAGVLLYIPFTAVLLRKFKKLVTEKPMQQQSTDNSLHDYVFRQRSLLRSFYHFKIYYELFLIPLSCAIAVALVFELYVTGGVGEHLWGAITIFLLSLGSCIAAVVSENKKSFVLPLKQLQNILDEF